MTAQRITSSARSAASVPGRGLAGVVARAVALAAMLAGAVGVASGAPGATADRSVLDVGGRVIAFEARPVPVMQFTLPFETGNALLLQEALQRLRQPDLGPFGASGGAVLNIVSVGGGDRKLAFERARTIRAALVRLGTAEARGLAAAARVSESGEGAAAAAGGETRIETVTVIVSRLTRASCAACSATTLGTAAMDTGAVGLATLETGRPATLAGTAATGARTADRREPETNLSFTDRPALATASEAGGISAADARALGAVAAAAAAGAAPTASTAPAPARGGEHPRVARPPVASAQVVPAPVASAPVASAPVASAPVVPAPVAPGRGLTAARSRFTAEAVKLADLRALGRAAPPGCRPRSIVIDDYLPPQQGWQCGSR